MTRASFNTIAGLIGALAFGDMAKTAFSAGYWVWCVVYVLVTGAFVYMFNNGYNNLPKK